MSTAAQNDWENTVVTNLLDQHATTYNVISNGGTAGGGWYYGGGYGGPSTSAPTIAPYPSYPSTTGTFTITNPPNRLSPEQITVLLNSHRFIEMDQGEYCLFCFAIDLYRTRADHDFTIREE